MAHQTDLIMKLMVFLAQDEVRFERFVSLTGLSVEDIRQRHADPVFQALVLDYVLQDQSLVLEFAASQELRPDALLKLRHSLPAQT